MERITSREFEKRILHELDAQAKRGRCSAGRYGVQAVIVPQENPFKHQLARLRAELDGVAYLTVRREDGEGRGTEYAVGTERICALVDEMQAYQPPPAWRPIKSLPDFEGALPGGRQFVFDAKLCSGASFPLVDDHFQRRQKKHLYERSLMGCITFLLIHFQERQLKKSLQEAVTVAFPVFPGHAFWDRVDVGDEKRITRSDAEQYAAPVEWTAGPGKQRPLVLQAVHAVAALMPPVRDGVQAA